MVEEILKIGLFVYTQHRRVADRRTDGQTRCRSKDHAMLCVARVTRSSADADKPARRV